MLKNREEALAAIAACEQSDSTELVLIGARDLTAEDYARIGSISKLTKLTMERCEVENEHLPEIARLTNLVELRLPDNRFSKLEPLKTLVNLEVLDISDGFFIGDDDVLGLLDASWLVIVRYNVATMPRLRELRLRRTQVTDVTCSFIKRIKTLRVLDFRDTDVGDFGVKHLRDLPLEEIGVSRKMTDEGLALLPATIKRAHIDYPNATARGIAKFIEAHRGLEFLYVYTGGRETSDIMGAVSLCSGLKELSVIGDFNDSDLRYIGSLENLERLFVSGHKFGMAWVKHLRRCPNLKHLSVAGNNFDNSALPELKTLTQITELNLNATYVSSKGVVDLREALPGCNVWDITFRIGRSHAF